MKTILLATDGSDCARRATTEAIELARATGWPLHVVTVWHIPPEVGYGVPGAVPEIIEAEREHAQTVSADTAAEARDAGVEATAVVRDGMPAEEICALARELPAALVVIGAHGWGPLKRILMGSVSTRVLHEAPCPVLVVRANGGDEVPAPPEQVAAGADS